MYKIKKRNYSKTNKSFNKKQNVILFLFIVIIVSILSSVFYYQSSLQPLNKNKEDVYFEVRSGETFYQVANRLESEQLIKNDMTFKLYLKLNKISGLEAGTYPLKSSYSVEKIISVLTSGKSVNLNAIQLTFPEGITMEEMAKIISEKTNNKYEDVLKAWSEPSFLNQVMDQYWFVTKDILNKQIRYPLEGYFFPSTYEFKDKDVTPETIALKLLDQMGKVLEPYKNDIEKSKMSVHEVLTLASIIEYEAILDEDRYLISGVFYNRLNKGMKLESCATLGYAINEHKLVYTTKDTKTQSPYNTYYVTGLPIGPGDFPSKNSIDAALHPKKNDFYFFLANVYDPKDPKTYYAKTYDEHLANKKKYLK